MLSGMKITEVSKYFRERKYGPSGSICNFLSFPLVGNLPGSEKNQKKDAGQASMTEKRHNVVFSLVSLPLVGNLPEPLFGKEGQGEILWRIDLFK
jgi:hypothetical protein